MPAVVIINEHEPEHEAATRLLEIADEKGYDARVVEAQRGEHDAALAFRVPQDVADEFGKDRAKRWPYKIENEGETDGEQDSAYLAGDAYAADNVRRAHDARVENALVSDEDNPQTPPVRTKERPGKAPTK